MDNHHNKVTEKEDSIKTENATTTSLTETNPFHNDIKDKEQEQLIEVDDSYLSYAYKSIQDEISYLKKSLIDNIDHAISNKEDIKVLEEKTEQLSECSKVFQQGSSTIRKHYWWTKNKVRLAFGTLASGGIATGLWFLL